MSATVGGGKRVRMRVRERWLAALTSGRVAVAGTASRRGMPLGLTGHVHAAGGGCVRGTSRWGTAVLDDGYHWGAAKLDGIGRRCTVMDSWGALGF